MDRRRETAPAIRSSMRIGYAHLAPRVLRPALLHWRLVESPLAFPDRNGKGVRTQVAGDRASKDRSANNAAVPVLPAGRRGRKLEYRGEAGG